MSNSAREERVLSVLMQYDSPSTKEIEDKAQVASARDYIRHLRDKGYKIETKESRVNGARVCRFHLLKAEPVELKLF